MNPEPASRPSKKRHLAAEERRRAVRACDECRRLKEKCEGGMPCKRCRHLRRPCNFNVAPTAQDKRAVDDGALLKAMMHRQRCMEVILKFHFPDLAMDIDSLQRACHTLGSPSSGPIAPGPSLNESTSISSPHNSAEVQPPDSPCIEAEDCTIDHVDGTTVHYSGEFSHWNFSMHIKRNIDELMARSSTSTSSKTPQVPDFIRVGEADPDSTSILDLIALIPPRPIAAFLANVFFKHATSLYFYVDRRWLDHILDAIQSRSTTLCSKDVTAVCVVLMVLAVGTQYVHLESPKRQSNHDFRGMASSDAESGWELEIGSAFYRHVSKLISEVIHAGSLLSVQVFLLLGLYCLPIDASGIGYIYLNLAIKVAIQNGMHRKHSRGVADPSIKEVRRRIWWTAYCMERKIGIYHGRPASIARSDIDADMPTSGRPDQPEDDSYNHSGLLESIKLTFEAEAFLHDINCLRICARSETATILDHMEHMRADLQARWAHFSDDSLSPCSTAPYAVQSKSRAEIHCRLEYCLLRMFIGRPFILTHRQARDSANIPQTIPGPRRKSAKSNAQWESLIQDCVAAAKEAIAICHSMQTTDMGLAKFSYAEYSTCRAALLVLIAYSTCYRTNDLSDILQIGLAAIREMASSGDSARSEVLLLEALEGALHQIDELNSRRGHAATADTETRAQEGYQGFFDWYKRKESIASSTENPVTGKVDYQANAGMAKHRQAPSLVGANANRLDSDSSPSDFPFDDYAFNFDFLSSGGGIDFFNFEQQENMGIEGLSMSRYDTADRL